MILTTCCFWLSMLTSTALAPGEEAGAYALHVTPTGMSTTPAVVTLGCGSDSGVAIGDPLWLLRGMKVVATGAIFMVAPTQSAARWTGTPGDGQGLTAVVVRQSLLVEARELLPDGVTLRGKLLRLPPGRRTAWLDIGASVGLRRGDMLLVSRKGIPVARGQVVEFEDCGALATLRPVVGNAKPQVGDAVELWPAPAERRQGMLNSVVLDVVPSDEGAFVRFVGSGADGVVEGRLVDLYRRDAYVGVARVEKVSDPVSAARMIESASIRKAEECDVAVVRPAPPDQPIRAAIFKVIEGGDVCLLAAGESDGVEVGERLVVYGSDPEDPSRRQEVADLIVDAVQYYHSEASVQLRNPAGGPLMSWRDFAERRKPAWRRWGAVGVIREVQPAGRWAVADVDPRCKLHVGQIVRCSPAVAESPGPPDRDRVPGAALILATSTDEAVLQVPAAWGDLEHLRHARVEVIMSTSAQASP